MPTEKELIELGKKAFAAKLKEKERSKATVEAVKKLVAAHREEYQSYLAEAGR